VSQVVEFNFDEYKQHLAALVDRLQWAAHNTEDQTAKDFFVQRAAGVVMAAEAFEIMIGDAKRNARDLSPQESAAFATLVDAAMESKRGA